MIDLRCKGLPNHINVAGKSFLINTDFRYWISLDEKINNDSLTLDDICKLVKDITLFDLMKNKDDFIDEIMSFYINENITPTCDKSDNTRILDYVEDGEYIVGSFLQAYGVDLTVCDMHWHKFLALFRCLPEETKIKQIISMRSYKKENVKYETQCERLKNAWALPQSISNIDDSLLNEINAEFYNS